MKIAVLGATGSVGDHFVRQALEKGYDLKVLVRNKAKFKHSDNPKVEVFVGDSTNPDDVTKVIAGADVVVSCLGNVKKDGKYILIMNKSHTNVLDTAAKQTPIPRCIFLSTVGCGGTSWLIKTILTMFVGKAGIADYEAADKRIREETKVPRLLVRPYALNDKQGTGQYDLVTKQSLTFAKAITREDVATFLVSAIKNKTWDDTQGVQLAGK